MNQSEVEKLLPSMPTIAMNSNILAAPPSSKTTGPIEKKVLKPMTMKKTYAQASKSNTSSNIEDVLWVKKVFPALSADKVGKMLKAKNSGIDNKKPKINMTTRELSRREVIISMTKVNTKLIVNSAYIHISNINNCLKNAKSDIIADFIWINVNGIVITTNKPAKNLDLSTIKKYLKNVININLDSIENSRLPKSKSYMKIVELSYLNKLGIITPDLIKGVLKDSYLFKNTVLASKPCVIKASPKSDKAVVWVDIWDSQSSSCVKNIINCQFNVGQFIATMHGTNMNLGVPQCKNCWKWEHSILSCHSHISRCAKCYKAYNTKHYREKAWCCIENKKLNYSATKDGEPCPHVFKYMNCKEDYQADSYSCPYWHNYFNREWHSRKQQELSWK